MEATDGDLAFELVDTTLDFTVNSGLHELKVNIHSSENINLNYFLLDKDVEENDIILQAEDYGNYDSLYHPIENVGLLGITYNQTQYNIKPFVMKQHQLDVESVYLEDDPPYEDERTITIYRGDHFPEGASGYDEYFGPDVNNEFLMYYRFRSGGAEYGAIDRFTKYLPYPDEYPEYFSCPSFLSVAITSAHKVDDANYPEVQDNGVGEIYAVCSVRWSPLSAFNEQSKSGLYVYRYEENLGSWTRIAYKEFAEPLMPHKFFDVGICARNNYLWVVWVNEERLETVPTSWQPSIRCTYIDNPKGRSEATSQIPDNEIVELFDSQQNPLINTISFIQLDLAWDDNIIFWANGSVFKGRPRLIWTDLISGYSYLKAGQIDLYQNIYKPTGYIVQYTDKTIDTAYSSVFYNPAITSNDYSRDINFSTADRIAFGAFKNPSESKSEFSRCETDDDWDPPAYITGPYNINSSSLADTSFRGFGTDRYIFTSNNKVMTNTEIIDDGSVNGERINTNTINLTDVFLGYANDGYLKIRHIDP